MTDSIEEAPESEIEASNQLAEKIREDMIVGLEPLGPIQ